MDTSTDHEQGTVGPHPGAEDEIGEGLSADELLGQSLEARVETTWVQGNKEAGTLYEERREGGTWVVVLIAGREGLLAFGIQMRSNS